MSIALDTLEYARRLRQAGFSEQQAEGQARALAAAMTDSLATKEDLHDLGRATQRDTQELRESLRQFGVRFDALEKHLDTRLDEQEKRLEIRLVELEHRFDAKLTSGLAGVRVDIAALETRLIRQLGAMMMAGIAVVSTLVKLL